MSISAIPMTDHIGAEIRGIDLSRPLPPEAQKELYALWLQHLVLLFRDQQLGQPDLLRVTGYFGKLAKLTRPKEYQPSGFKDLLDGIMLISNIRENGVPIGSLPDGEMHFHHDTLHSELPHKGTFLYSVEVPSRGGNTLFASGYAAYETLPPDIRARAEGRRAHNHYYFGAVTKGDPNAVAASSAADHPVIRTHEETGRKAIYVNRLMTESIVGMPEDESKATLARIFAHSEKPDWVYEHVWRPGDLVLWDNRCSMHARTDFPSGERRLMLRTTIQGDVKPF
jgi:taurine dioxygenase